MNIAFVLQVIWAFALVALLLLGMVYVGRAFQRSRIVGAAQFAQIPLLNDRQLVARWQQELPPTYVSDSQELPIDPLAAGLYLLTTTAWTLGERTVLRRRFVPLTGTRQRPAPGAGDGD